MNNKRKCLFWLIEAFVPVGPFGDESDNELLTDSVTEITYFIQKEIIRDAQMMINARARNLSVRPRSIIGILS